MFYDLVKMMSFALTQLKVEKRVSAVQDVYIQLSKLYKEIDLIIITLCKDIEYEYARALDITPKSKWMTVLNKHLNAYENLMYGMFCTLSKLGDKYVEEGSLSFSDESTIFVGCYSDVNRLKLIDGAIKDKVKIGLFLIELKKILQRKFGLNVRL